MHAGDHVAIEVGSGANEGFRVNMRASAHIDHALAHHIIRDITPGRR